MFYDLGNGFQRGTFGDLKMSQIGVTTANGVVVGPRTLSNWLGSGNAAVPNFPILGSGGPALVQAGILQYPADGNPNQSNYPQFTLVHEVLLHAYAGVSDPQMLDDNFFSFNGLFDTGQGSTAITGWMSTDCKCTPGRGNCQANTATW
jgi:hypothetical protein